MSVMFGKWMNVIPTLGAAAALGGGIVVIGGFWYWATPKFWEVGYMPSQPDLDPVYVEALHNDPTGRMPIPGHDFPGFSHQIHAGKLGLDCRYCHTNVEASPEANIPPVSTCIGCHAENHVQLPPEQDKRVKFIRDAFAADESIPWRRVHKLPDYVRNFPHNIHVNAGVSCFSCHGQIMGMPVVAQREPLSMAWCLDCHRETAEAPEKRLVPREKVTDLLWVETHMQEVAVKGSAAVVGFDAKAVYESLRMNPPTNCGACHY